MPQGAKNYAKGTLLEKEGQKTTRLFFILKGTVGLFKAYQTPKEAQVATLSTGDFFGEKGALLGLGADYSAVTLSDAAIFSVSEGGLLDFFKSQSQMAFSLAQSLARKAYGVAAPVAEAPDTAAPKAETPKPRPAPTPVPTTAAALFLPGHGTYKLELNHHDDNLFLTKNMACPQCGAKFAVRAVKGSKLVSAGMDPDRRMRYRGVEPMYYDVISCPACLYSATMESFANGIRRPDKIAPVLAPFKELLPLVKAPEIDETSIFAAHYMALACAPLCFSGPLLVQGRLWQKLMRLYGDCGDAELEMKAAQMSLQTYVEAYSKTEISPKAEQNLCIILAELYVKTGDITEAKKFFFKAKVDRMGAPELKRHAEDRLEDLKDTQ